MKGCVIILSILLLPLVLAVEIDMKSQFSQGETLMAKVSGNFYNDITRSNIMFYRGYVRTSIPVDVAKINNEFYIYGQLFGKTPTDYSMKIENVRYWEGTKIVDDPIVADFSITGDTADFSVNPGFVIDNDDFFIQVQNLQSSQIDVKIGISGDQPSVTENEIRLYPGEVKKILFSVDGVRENSFETIQLSTSNLNYDIPAYIIGTPGCDSDNDCDSDEVCVDNSCVYVECKTNDDCYTSEACIDNECIYQECLSNSDCDSDELCIDGLCEYQAPSYECLSNSDCDSDEVCFYHECIYQECLSNSDCDSDELCIDGECIYQECLSNSDCDSDELCIDGECIFQECFDNYDCDSDESCTYGQCVYQGEDDECYFSFQCGSNEVCLYGECVYQECYRSSDCDSDEVCIDNKCVYQECYRSSDCDSDEVCTDNQCIYEECESDEDCESDEVCVDGRCEAGGGEIELSFDFSELSASISTNSETTRIIYLENTGDETIEDISLLVSKRLEDYVSFSIDKIDELESGSSIEIDLTIESGDYERELEGQIIARADDVIYARSAIFLSFKRDYVPPSNGGGGDGEGNIKTCAEKGAKICDWNTENCGGDVYYGEEKCCLGTCENKEEDSTGKIIGWSIVGVIVLFFVWFYFSKYKKTKGREGLFGEKKK